MKKYQFWSLLLGLTFGSLTFVACGGDDDDDSPSNGGGGNNNPPVSLDIKGSWGTSHHGEDGTSNSESWTFNEDGTFEWIVTETYNVSSWSGSQYVKTLKTSQRKGTGTYTSSTSQAVTLNQTAYYRSAEDGTMEKDSTVKETTTIMAYIPYGNGFICMSRMGGINMFTRKGETRQLPNMASHELTGKWQNVQTWTDQPFRETRTTIEFKADGSFIESNEQWDTEKNFYFQGMRSYGYFVTLDNPLVSLEKKTIPEGAKFFSMVEDYTNYYEQTGEGTGEWKFSACRYGGHPLQYIVKDGKLYYGMIGQEEKWFYERPFTKVK